VSLVVPVSGGIFIISSISQYVLRNIFTNDR
jgi:hypothetical protein